MEISVEVEEVEIEATRERILRELEDKVTEETQKYIGKYGLENEEQAVDQYGRPFLESVRNSAERDAYLSYFNNFSLRLPSNHERIGDSRRILDTKDADVPYRSGMSKDSQDGIWHPSTKKLDQTPRQFFATIDQAIEKEGINMDELARLNSESDHGVIHPYDFYKFTLPVYVRLVALGYNAFDLTA